MNLEETKEKSQEDRNNDAIGISSNKNENINLFHTDQNQKKSFASSFSISSVSIKSIRTLFQVLIFINSYDLFTSI